MATKKDPSEIGTSGEDALVRTIDVGKVTGWRDGRIYLEDLALTDAAAEMNRHSPVQISVDDPQIAQLRVNGMFRAGESRSPHSGTPMCPGLEPPGAFHLPQGSHNKLQYLVGARQHRLYPLEVGKIDYIEAQGNYVTVRRGTSDYIRRDSIKRLAACLADWGFMRIERSLLLNVRAVAYAQAASDGTFVFTLASGTCFQSSASYRDAILNVLPLVPVSKRKERGGFTRSGGK
jgi:hypothetical protein